MEQGLNRRDSAWFKRVHTKANTSFLRCLLHEFGRAQRDRHGCFCARPGRIHLFVNRMIQKSGAMRNDDLEEGFREIWWVWRIKRARVHHGHSAFWIISWFGYWLRQYIRMKAGRYTCPRFSISRVFGVGIGKALTHEYEKRMYPAPMVL